MITEILQLDVLRIGLVVAAGLLVTITCIHVLLHKPEPRSAALWIVICVLFPLGGMVLYVVFGVNRLNRRARRRAAGELTTRPDPPATGDATDVTLEDYSGLVRAARRVTGLPLVGNCQLQPLFNGNQAFPEMLAAINGATDWVYLSSYIFDYRGVGQEFIDALVAADQRGVAVRVIIDGIGEWYDGGKTRRLLRRQGVDAHSFLPPRLVPPQLAINLRNHRKLLLVDGNCGFVGGMNIRRQHTQQPGQPLQIQDLAVKLHGPVLAQLGEVASDDWRYVTGQEWTPATTNPVPIADSTSNSFCRTIADGPDQSLNKLLAVLLGAISSAQQSIRIMTPYFLPPRELDALLQVAARSGIEVSVILPVRGDHRLVHWAAQHRLPTLINAGINIYFQPPPFAHTKLLIIDNSYVQFGSANIDARSLRLNFELMVESYDAGFANTLINHFDQIQGQSQRVTAAELTQTSLWRRIRNASCWLFSPNL